MSYLGRFLIGVRIQKTSNKLTWRTVCSFVTSESRESTREKLWKHANKKYSDHPTILYSSYLESQVEYMPNWTRNTFKGKTSRKILKQELEFASVQEFPKNWMEDYEFYEGSIDSDGNINSKHGTTDPSCPTSTVLCSGCGANFHCASTSLPGYIPKEIFKGRSNKELQTIVCQRCHFLKTYNIALDVEVKPETYINTISAIEDDYALAVLIVDLLDFPCSIWPGMQKILGTKRPIFVVGNKVDVLPRDCNGYLDRIKTNLKDQLIKSGFDAMNLKYISLISAKTGYGIEELITQLHKLWKYKGNVYLLGCTNVGKSSLFNILLNSDYCRPEASDLVRKATVCPWPGTTLQMLKFPILRPSDIRVYVRYKRLFSQRAQRAAIEKLQKDQIRKGAKNEKFAQLIGNVGQTFVQRKEVFDTFSMSAGTDPIVALNEKSAEYRKARWCYDTPGVIHPDQITNLLTTEELLALQPTGMIRPRAFRLKCGMSMFISGLARLDFLNCSDEDRDWIKAFYFGSLKLPVVITPTEQASEMYSTYLGTKILGFPYGNEERLSRWPGLKCKDEVIRVRSNKNDFEEIAKDDSLSCDIVLSSAGWIGLKTPINTECAFKAWTPDARGIYLRESPLIPYANRLVGKHIQFSLAYNLSQPYVFKK